MKLPRLQLHLSTLLLLTVLAGAFIGANVHSRVSESSVKMAGTTLNLLRIENGFPCTYLRRTEAQDSLQSMGLALDDEENFDRSALVLNCLSGLMILAGAGYLAERIARRRQP